MNNKQAFWKKKLLLISHCTQPFFSSVCIYTQEANDYQIKKNIATDQLCLKFRLLGMYVQLHNVVSHDVIHQYVLDPKDMHTNNNY